MGKTKRKALHSRPKTAPESGAITARKSLHSAKTPIALLCRRSNDHADVLFLGAFLGFNTPNALTLALRANQFARLEPVHGVPARKIVQAVFYVFMAHFPKNRV
jgi:hypothetical protein